MTWMTIVILRCEDDGYHPSCQVTLRDARRRAIRRLRALSSSDRPVTLEMRIDAYLSPAHRDHLESSCAVARMAADVARAGDRAKVAYSKPVEVSHKHQAPLTPVRPPSL